MENTLEIAAHGVYYTPMRLERSPFLTFALAVMVVLLALQLYENQRRDTVLQQALMELRNQTAPYRQESAPPSSDSTGTGMDATLIYKEVSPSVVAVANMTLVRRGFFGFQLYETPRGAGSGIVWDKKGHIVSNYHVVHQASSLIITFPDGARYEAGVVGIAPDYDLAVLKVEAPADKLRPVVLARSRRLEVGEPVFAIGNPFGLDTTLSSGIVSALGRTITSMTERRIHDVIQTDAAINPGNSGGPLLDGLGRVVGVNTAILSPSGAYAGIGFAVPSDTVSRVVPQLIEHGRVTRAGLGAQFLPDHVTARTGMEGVAIYAVYENTPAARAGIKGLSINQLGTLVLGDIVTAIDGTSVRTIEDLRKALDTRTPGEEATLTLRRSGGTRTVSLRLIQEE